MATDVATKNRDDPPVTSQIRETSTIDRGLAYFIGRILAESQLTQVATANAVTAAVIPASYQSAPKMAEIERQIERLKAAKKFAESKELDAAEMSDISSSIDILRSLVQGPLPIPVAGWSLDSGPSLFYDQNGFYGDLEISNSAIEYFLKWNDSTGANEIFDSEAIEEGKLPPKLLVHLYRAFARSNAQVR